MLKVVGLGCGGKSPATFGKDMSAGWGSVESRQRNRYGS